MWNGTNWKKVLSTGGLTALAAPFTVLLHELAHIIAFTLAGIPSHLVAFGMAMPVGYQWNIESLGQAQMNYDAGDGVFVAGVLIGPLLTLLLGYGGLLAYRRWNHIAFWAAGFSAIGLRMTGVLMNAPKVMAGTINTSDEVVTAYFLGRPTWIVYWPSVALGLTCVGLLIMSLPKGSRLGTAFTGIVCSIAGFLVVESLVNILVFNLETWTR